MAKFHTLSISDIKRETTDAVSIAFDVPGDLKEDYRFIQGQYLTFKMNMDGEEVRRSYSICTSPVTDDELRIAVKEVEGGKMSPYLNRKANIGDEVEVMTPMGNFYTELNPSNENSYVFFAGGSGITPVMSIIKTMLNKEPNSRIKLFYANRNPQSVIFRDQLAALDNAHGNLAIEYIFDSATEGVDELHTGLMTREKVEKLVGKYVNLEGTDEFFVCGPTPMMDNIISTLKEQEVDKKKIHVEYFTTVLDDLSSAEEKAKPEPPGEGFSGTAQVTVIIDGEETEFELDADGESILDTAIDEGLDVPFSCKGAVCSTCKAKILEGKVTMDMNYALEDDEVEEGYALTCQSHPASKKVVVDYDEM